jgi:hypothetical protein
MEGHVLINEARHEEVTAAQQEERQQLALAKVHPLNLASFDSDR